MYRVGSIPGITGKNYYKLAQQYFKAVIDNPGNVKFITTDSRTPANPYQVFFQQMHTEDETYADENDPAQFPGWRGVNNDWSAYGLTLPETYAPNLAIKGLFAKLSEDDINALETEGYKKTNWAVDLVKAEAEYSDYLFLDYDYVKAPIYLWPFTPNVMANGHFTNGYGFKQE